MKRVIFLLFILAACGTPQQQCISGATRDLRVVERLIAETEANLKRGYGYQTETIWRWDWQVCGPVRHTKSGKRIAPQMCWDREPVSVRRPAAIDLAAEKRKLAQLLAKRRELLLAAKPAVAQCQATYPE